jgi:hypothetical protein
MRRTLPALAVSLLIPLFAAAPALANHTHVGSSVIILKGAITTDVYLSDDGAGHPLIPCTGTFCETTVPMNGGDQARFSKACGDSIVPLTIPAGSTSTVKVCSSGHGPWSVRVAATLNDCSGLNCVATTHAAPVDVEVFALHGGHP